MNLKTKPVYFYLAIGFSFGFLISLAGYTFENYIAGISVVSSVSQPLSYLSPAFLGILTALISSYYWKRKSDQNYEINQAAKNIKSLLDINLALVSSIDLDVVLQKIVDKSVEIINLETGAIYLHDNDKLYLAATYPDLPSDFPEFMRSDFLSNHNSIKKALDSRKPVIIPDVSKLVVSENERQILKVRNLKSVLYLPLILEDRPIGTLILGTCSGYRDFTEDEINLYSTFTSLSALAIENAKLYRNSKIIAEQLRKKNNEFASLNELLSEKNYNIQKINEEYKIALQKAEESDRLKTAFLQNISHEIRTPLNTIVGFSQLIVESEQSKPKNREFAEKISSGSDKLINIITDVIEISEIQAGTIRMNYAKTEIISLLRSVIESFESKSIEKNIKLIFQNNLPFNKLEFETDEEKLRKTFYHLIHNAFKFTKSGSIEISCDFSDEELQVKISDTGIGIAPEYFKYIFEPFKQVESNMVKNYGGNGIGLSLAKSYTELLDGKISLNSRLNEGSIFTVTLPLKKYTDSKSDKVKKPVFSLQNSVETILIVDDEYANYLYLYELLQPTKIEILHASNGQEAVDICKTNRSVDLVLMDIKMPVMNGYTAAKLIKEFRPELPIIAQTAYTLEHENMQNVSLFNDYIIKPINKNEFRHKMMVYIDR